MTAGKGARGRPGEVIELPEDDALKKEIKRDLMALPTKTRVALFKHLEVFGPETAIPKERVRLLKNLHDVYVLPQGRRGPFAVVVRDGYSNRLVLAGVRTRRPMADDAEAMAERALDL